MMVLEETKVVAVENSISRRRPQKSVNGKTVMPNHQTCIPYRASVQLSTVTRAVQAFGGDSDSFAIWPVE
jgi:hypothetical protein